jgi:hypothetical protein
MRVLFDQGTPAPLRTSFAGCEVVTLFEKGWSQLANGELLRAAELEFDLFVSTDKNLRYQQQLNDRRIRILILPTTSWPRLRPYGEQIARCGLAMSVGEYVEWVMPAE